MREYKEGDFVLARYVPACEAWEGNLKFFSENGDFIQFGTWGYDSKKELLPHIHNEVKREVYWTQEVIFVRKGSILAHIYDTKANKIDEVVVSEGDLIVLLRGGHGYTILEDGTQVLEVKNGPYVGADKDRRRF